MNSKSILSEFNGCFLNQTILIPRYNYFIDHDTWCCIADHRVEYQIQSSSSIVNEYLSVIWMVMFWISFLSTSMFVYRLLENIFYSFYSECSLDVLNEDKLEPCSNVVDDMRTMMNEISDLSIDEKQMKSEKYYILTNLLVNRFRIEVYEKILK